MAPLPSPSTPPTQTEPKAPPPPPPPEDLRTKISPAVLKLKTKAHEHLISSQRDAKSSTPAPIGPYFFYGSLLDPSVLTEILGLDQVPELRPASLDGYECKLWGQYPALRAKEGSTVEGAVYNVARVEDAEKLAAYETMHYGLSRARFGLRVWGTR